MSAHTLTIVRDALHSSGIIRIVRASKRRACRIVVYHRFPEDRSRLTAQCGHIRRHYHPVSMSQVAVALSTGTPLPNNAIAVTVDDGFRDYLLFAHAVFAKYEIPTTVFVVTDFLDGNSWLWFSKVEYMIHRTRRASVRFLGRQLSLEGDRERAANTVVQALKLLPNSERLAQMEELRRLLGVGLPEGPPAGYEPLSWDEVRRLASDGVEFGAHTRTHPVLSRISDSHELLDEISGSRHRLEEELGSPTLHFCYPFGTWADLSDETVSNIRRCGFATAVTAESGFNYAGIDPLRLFRLHLDHTFSERHSSEVLAGIRKY